MTEADGGFFIMGAGQPKKEDGHIYVFGPPCTRRAAHASAEAAYRKERSLPTSVFVQTNVLHEVGSEAEARSFVERLTALINEEATVQEATDV